MQIVIDIDDNLYTRLFDNGDEYVADMRRACVAIRKGTPFPKGHSSKTNEVLDEIRAEIEEQVLESLSDGGDDWYTAEKVNDCLEIIDKYRVESEEV